MKKKILLLRLMFLCLNVFGQKFAIAVIPDTQGYTYWRNQRNAGCPIDFSDILMRQMDYIVNNSVKNNGDIIFAIHLGDSVESRNKSEEWEIADIAMSKLDENIPFCIVPGNHDYDTWVFDENRKKNIINGLEKFNKYFGCQSFHFENKKWYGGSYNGGANSYQIIDYRDVKILHIGLEIEPSDAVLDWAQSVINENKGLPTIVTTHQYLKYSYDSYMPGFASYHGGELRYGYDRNSSIQVWKKFISINDQIFLVLCGHFFDEELGIGEGVRCDTNVFGNKVYSMLSDYQGRKEIYSYNKELSIKNGKRKKRGCGDGWLRLLRFDLQQQQITVKTYSTEMNKYEKDPDSNFLVKFDFDWNTRFYKGK